MSTLASFAVALLQVLVLLAIAPGLNGLIKKIKARFQRRVGPPLVQGYRDLAKLFIKETVHAGATSPIFWLAPSVSLGATVVAAAAFPAILARPMLSTGDLLTAVYLLALGRFFVALAGLDAASAFGGLGSSRDMAIASLAEPVAMVCILVVAAGVGAPTDGAALATAGQGLSQLAPWRLLAAAAFFMVVLAECARVPVDNPATHLELTMVHEAMLLEHTGPELALLTLGAQLKQTVLLALFAALFFPIGMATAPGPGAVALAAVVLVAKLALLAALIALVESTIAKLRLFRVPDFLGSAFGLALLAFIAREAF
jgi:formate hydrogenlyase subunit 4